MKVLFIGRGSNGKISPLIKQQADSLVNLGIEIDYFTIEEGGIKGYIKAIKPLKAVLRQKKYDLMHAHFGLSGISARLAASRIPILVSFMGDDVMGSPDRGGSYGWQGNIIALAGRFFAKRFFDHSIVKTKQMRERMASVKKVDVIPNGINPQIFKPIDMDEAKAKLQLEPGSDYILFAAQPDRPVKNFPLFKKAFDLLATRNDKLRILTLDNIPFEQVPYYYNSAHVVVMTSFHEGSPNVVKEAMACSRPVVSTDIGDVKEIFGNTEGCFLSTFDANDLAAQIEKALLFNSSTTGAADIPHLHAVNIAKRINAIYTKLLAS